MSGDADDRVVAPEPAPAAAPKVRIWDLPTRLFHWALAALVVISFTTGKIGGNAMTWHMWSGYAILSLLLFRLLWGFAGSRYARFATFVPGPAAVIAYVRALATRAPGARAAGHAAGGFTGHSPLGALAVIAMLLAVLTQAGTGLVANDEIFTEGPLAQKVSGATSALATTIHRYNEYVILGLVALHLLAIAFYFVVRKDDLVGPMIVGDKEGVRAVPCVDDVATRVRALVLLAVCAGAVTWLVNL
jgi:cytochrome b